MAVKPPLCRTDLMQSQRSPPLGGVDFFPDLLESVSHRSSFVMVGAGLLRLRRRVGMWLWLPGYGMRVCVRAVCVGDGCCCGCLNWNAVCDVCVFGAVSRLASACVFCAVSFYGMGCVRCDCCGKMHCLHQCHSLFYMGVTLHRWVNYGFPPKGSQRRDVVWLVPQEVLV